jgi:hypothetical protein
MAVTQLSWTPQNATQKATILAQMTEQVQYLRDLLPDSGAYVNEVCSCGVEKRGGELTCGAGEY